MLEPSEDGDAVALANGIFDLRTKELAQLSERRGRLQATLGLSKLDVARELLVQIVQIIRPVGRRLSLCV